MEPHRLRAPAADGAVLAEPPLAAAVDRLAENAARLAAWDYDFQGRRADRLRALARYQVRARARAYHERFGLDLDLPEADDPARPVVVTGHQPELFHPGVWIKNFAIAGIARQAGAVALNLIVDNDIPKATAIRVPRETEAGLRALPVLFDDWAGEIPYEDLAVQDEGLFASFGDRVLAALAGQVPDPIIEEYWPLARAAAHATDRLGLRLAAARRRLEGSWGVANAEAPLSDLCETEAFLWFASHLLAQLPRFQEVHNGALLRYRQLYGIRSKHHPVPALAREGDWLEAPFWIWRAESPRRRPLLARQRARTLELRIGGEATPLMELPLGPDREACCAVEQLRELPARGIRLRTRALTTTMFARLLLGDLFLHGIGGAKYDELGDEIIRRFFGIEPPTYLTLSMTLWLGLPDEPVTADDLKAVERLLRDLTYNPDRHLNEPIPPDVAAWIEAKRRAIAAPQATRHQRVARCREIRRCNAALQEAVAAQRERLQTERARLAAALRRNKVARHREYSFVLQSRSRLRSAFARVVPGVLTGSTEKIFRNSGL